MNNEKSKNIEQLLNIIKNLLEADRLKIAQETINLPNRKYIEITLTATKEIEL